MHLQRLPWTLQLQLTASEETNPSAACLVETPKTPPPPPPALLAQFALGEDEPKAKGIAIQKSKNPKIAHLPHMSNLESHFLSYFLAPSGQATSSA
jgi:hypothetical protein